MEEFAKQTRKQHRKPSAGPSADKKKAKKDAKGKGKGQGDKASEKERKRNPKAFGAQSTASSARQASHKLEKMERKLHVPLTDRSYLADDPAPVVVAVVGPPSVGKTTLIRSLVKHYTKHSLSEIKGPVTVVSSAKQRLTFIDTPCDVPAMMDAAKAFGFEMETFEFLNILQVHGFPKVMGVLTHLDSFKINKKLRRTKKILKHRFWTDVYPGAKLFYLSSLEKSGRYPKREVSNLARFISVAKYRPLIWRNHHPYILADRFEDVTPTPTLQADPLCDRHIAFYGYVRGTYMRQGQPAHIPGLGDVRLDSIARLDDPCPLVGKGRKRGLGDKDRLLYAPMTDVGGIVVERDATYVDIPDAHVVLTQGAAADGDISHEEGEGVRMLRNLQAPKSAMDALLARARLQFFKGSEVLESQDVDDRSAPPEEQQHAVSASGRLGPKEKIVKDSGGRTRRLAVFDDEEEESCADGSDVEEGEGRGENLHFDDDSEDGGDFDGGVGSGGGGGGDDDDDDDDDDGDDDDDSDDEEEHGDDGDDDEEEDEEDRAGLKWKRAAADRVAKSFAQPRVNLAALVYGDATGGKDEAVSKSSGSESEGDDDDFFTVKGSSKKGKPSASNAEKGRNGSTVQQLTFASDDVECLVQHFFTSSAVGARASADEAKASAAALRARFVNVDTDRELIKALGQAGDNEVGDWEDLETGDKFGQGESDDDDDDEEEEEEEEDSRDEQEQEEKVAPVSALQGVDKIMEDRRQRKMGKKAAFDSEYDGKGKSKGTDSKALREEAGDALANPDAPRGLSDAAKAANRAEFADMDPKERARVEGYRPGQYVRVIVTGVPCEFVRYFDPKRPVIVGGLLQGESNFGFVQVRLKRHRWHRRILKNFDPLIFSVGWRRFQSIPMYSIKDVNGRMRMLKYTPEHMHCSAVFWGPITVQNTGIIAFQKLSNSVAGFRVSATGVVTSMDAGAKTVKKLKIVGQPFKIFKKTAFIKGMFTSPLECARFEGAKLRTVSGVRGQIKKALKDSAGGGPGAFRAMFEDKLLMSDIVFLRTWVPVEPKKLYNPVTSLLCENSDEWTPMRTIAQMRLAIGASIPVNKDSLYTPIERRTRHFSPLQIPKKLQEKLPFTSKPKLVGKRAKESYMKKRAVVMDSAERKVTAFLQQVNTIHNRKVEMRKQQKERARAEHTKKIAISQRGLDEYRKEEKKKRCRKIGQEEARKKSKESSAKD